MKLKNKLLLSQILVFLVMFFTLTVLLPHIVYLSSGEKELENAMNFNEQIMMRMERCFDEVERFSTVVGKDDGLNELLEAYMEEPVEKNAAKIRLYLSGMGRKDSLPPNQVLGIYLNVSRGEKNYSFNTVGISQSVKSHIQQQVLPKMREEEKNSMFVQPFTFVKEESTAFFGSNFNMGYGYARQYGKNGITGQAVIVASYDEIIYIAQDVNDYCNDFLLLNGDNVQVAPSVKDSDIDVNTALSDLTIGDSYMEGFHRDEDGVTVVRYSQNRSWKLLSRLTREEIIANNRSLILLNEILVAIFGICVVAVMVPLVRKFVGPLGEVSRQMGEIAKGNLSARVTVKSRDEIGEASESFNIMAGKLEDNIQELIEKEKLEQTMRYSLLVSQVDPHFIYNTMNTITYLAQKERNEDVIAVNRAMIEILRDRLRIEISEVYDTVEQELNVTRQYLIIQKYRYEGTFKTKMDVDEEVKGILIAKNVIQPLVENALFHGILENKDENGEILGGCITITAHQEEGEIVLSIEDNGAGMSRERLDEILNQSKGRIRGAHIGIRNIRERIKYIYGESYNLEISSKERQGTKVVVRLPAVINKEV